MPEETPQTPADPALEIWSEQTPSSAKPRKKRIKTPAGRTDLAWVRKLIALKFKTSLSSQHTSQKQPSQPTRKSYRLAAQGSVRSSITKQGPPVIEEILSSSEGSPIKTLELATVPQESLFWRANRHQLRTAPSKHPSLGLF